MSLPFNLTEDELPIFLGDASEQIELLNAGFIRLEKDEQDAELLQALFRAAHTLKGAAGMIDHKRMVELTHALETVLDGVRKKQIPISTNLIDICLEAVDALQLLCEEVVKGESSQVDITSLVLRLTVIAQSAPEPCMPGVFLSQAAPAADFPSTLFDTHKTLYHIQAEISKDCVASAARALQILLALQEVGEILWMKPDQDAIEASTPVKTFLAWVASDLPAGKIHQALDTISDLEHIRIDEQETDLLPPASPMPDPEQESSQPSRLGEILVSKGLISEQHLQQALEQQARADGSPAYINPTTVRIRVERLDALFSLVGELIGDQNQLYLVHSNLGTQLRGNPQIEILGETITHLSHVIDRVQAEVLGIRMLTIASIFDKFPRMVRDLALKANKQVDLVIKGEKTELDRSVIEEIHDPLIHLIRNAIDHGLEAPGERLAKGKPERGVIIVSARHEQGRILVTVEDNGRGIDLDRVKATAVQKGMLTESEATRLSEEEAVNLIFSPGLSTAESITDLSGRGVGMDIVKQNIERLNGSILVETWPGRGSRFQLILPLTPAIMRS